MRFLALLTASSLLAAASWFTAAPAAAAATAAADEVIRAIELRMEQPPERPIQEEDFLAFAIGEELTDSAVRRTLSNFYATGLFAEAAVYQRRDPEGLTAVVVLRPAVWIEQVLFEGELGLSPRVLRREVLQAANAPLSDEDLLRSVYALQDLYKGRGYRDASVRLDVREHGRYRAEVAFKIRAGERSRIGDLRFSGVPDEDLRIALREALRTDPGDAYKADRFDNETTRLIRKLAKLGYRGARIEILEVDRIEENLIDLTYQVDLGQRILIEIDGFEQKRLSLGRVLPALEMPVYDEALLSRYREEVFEYFQRDGYFEAQVEIEERLVEDELRLEIQVVPGQAYNLNEVLFDGNETFSAEQLKVLMSTSSESWGADRLVRKDLNEDLDNLSSYYALQGFSEAHVGPAQITFIDDGLKLLIPIEEGPRRRIVRFALNGVETLDPDTVLGRLPLRPGGPYHPVLVEDAINVLRGLYDEVGHPLVLVETKLDWSPEGDLVDVLLEVDEGPQRTVDRILLRGYRRTRPEVLSQVIDLKPGDPISRRALLEAERDLYQLGIFSRVDVALAATAEQPGMRDVTIRLEEGRRWRLGYGVSYHSDDGIGGLLSVSRVNLRGRGERFQLDLRASERDRRFRLIYDQPIPAGRLLPITYTIFRQDEERESFTVDEFGGQIALTRPFSENFFGTGRLGLAYDYRQVELSAETIDPNQIDRENRDLQISSITPYVTIDRRDDPLDPTRGWSALVQLEYAFPMLEATADFLKVFAQQTFAIPLGRFGVLAGSLRAGAIEPNDPDAVRDPLVPPELASSLIPASERFFAGGRTTHRAYERDLLGIPDRTLFERPDAAGNPFTVSSGGNGLVLLNLDYRFPIGGGFGGTVFFDAGNVWSDWEEIDFDDIKPGIGIGVRYASPIGPVRLEMGWKLDREQNEDNPVFFLSFGNPF